jgi:hypothetical protein
MKESFSRFHLIPFSVKDSRSGKSLDAILTLPFSQISAWEQANQKHFLEDCGE